MKFAKILRTPPMAASVDVIIAQAYGVTLDI